MRDADVLGYPVRRGEPDAVDVLGQRIGIRPDLLNRLVAVSLVDADRPAGTDSLRMEEDHDLADDLLLGPGPFDPASPLRPDAVHLLQAGRIVLDDVEDLLSELVHQLPGIDRPDALDHAAAEVFLNALLCGWGRALEQFGAELEPEIPVADPPAFRRYPFTRIDGGQRANHRDLVSMALGLDLEHRKAVLLVEERDALNQAGQTLGRRGRVRLQSDAFAGREHLSLEAADTVVILRIRREHQRLELLDVNSPVGADNALVGLGVNHLAHELRMQAQL